MFEMGPSFFYNPKIEDHLPNTIKIIKGDFNNPLVMSYRLSTNRHLGPSVQIPYETTDENGGRENPDTVEFDIDYAYDLNSQKLSIHVCVNFGDLTASEFEVESPNNIKVIVYTSLHSKDDSSNTIFAMDDESLSGFINYLNSWESSLKLTIEDFKFLDSRDNYKPE